MTEHKLSPMPMAQLKQLALTELQLLLIKQTPMDILPMLMETFMMPTAIWFNMQMEALLITAHKLPIQTTKEMNMTQMEI